MTNPTGKGGFQLGVGDKSAVRLVVKERMSQGTAKALVKEDEEDGDEASKVQVWTIPTNEELVVARQTKHALEM